MSVSTPVLLAAVLFGVVWSITEDECLPGGNLFGITVLFICALIGGKLMAFIRLPNLPPFPPLLGKAEDFSGYALCSASISYLVKQMPPRVIVAQYIIFFQC